LILLEKVKLKRKLKRILKEISLEKKTKNLEALDLEKQDILDKINYIKVLIFIIYSRFYY